MTPARAQAVLALAVAVLLVAGLAAAAVHDSGTDVAASRRPTEGRLADDALPDTTGTSTADASLGAPLTPAGGNPLVTTTAPNGRSSPPTTRPRGGAPTSTTARSSETVGARPCQPTHTPISLQSSAPPFATHEPGLYVIRPDRTGVHRVLRSPTDRTFYGASFAPDGYRFVASDDQQMWIGNAEGTENNAVDVGKGLKNPMYPAWSPDGRTIAFGARAGDESTPTTLWVMNADGSNRRQVPGSPERIGEPVWSPDSQWLVVTTYGFGIWVVRPDGTGLRRLASGTVPFSVSWARSTELAVIGEIDGRHGLHVLSFDGSARRSLASVDGHVAWSPDCASIATAGPNVSLFDPADGERREIAGGGSHLHYNSPSWAPDAESLVVTAGVATETQNGWKNDQDVVVLSGGSRHVLVDMDDKGWVAHARGWSPNGEWVLFCVSTY